MNIHGHTRRETGRDKQTQIDLHTSVHVLMDTYTDIYIYLHTCICIHAFTHIKNIGLGVAGLSSGGGALMGGLYDDSYRVQGVTRNFPGM